MTPNIHVHLFAGAGGPHRLGLLGLAQGPT